MANERILVVDDEEDVLDMCIRALSLQGYQVSGVHNGLEAIDKAQKEEFDLLLTDVKMPGPTGLQTYHAIKQHQPDIIGVVITAYSEVDTAIEALKLGIDDFLLKPFSLDELGTAISKALAKKRLERENARLKALIPFLQLSQALVARSDLDALLQQVLQLALQETAADWGVLMLRETTSANLEVRAACAEGIATADPAYRLGEGIVRTVMDSGEPVMWESTSAQEPFFTAQPVNSAIATAVALRLTFRGEVIGILGLAKQQNRRAFSRSDIELLTVAASQAAIAIQNARLFTRIRDAYDKLSVLDHLKSEFISIAAHELRTPLAEINTYITLLQQDQEDNVYLAHTARALERLNSLVNNLTDLKSLEEGLVELRLTELSLPLLASDVVRQLAAMAESKELSVTVGIPSDLPKIRADVSKMRIVLSNLISNAIRFTPQGGHIVIRAECVDHGLRIAVQDSGIGIPKDEWEWVFKPFYQLESSLTRVHGGIGTGLAMAKSLVELHGGRIWLESTVGQGSTFYFTIPDCLCGS